MGECSGEMEARLRLAVVGLVVLFAAASAAMARPMSRGLFGCNDRTPGCHMPPPDWFKIEADNGQEVYVDLASIAYRRDLVPPYSDENGKVGKIARVLIYFDDGMSLNLSNAGWYDYDCDDPYLIGRAGVWTPQPAQYLPPRSLGYQLREIACGGPY